MRTYDRQGIHIEQCDHCGGIFLDRGELEQMVQAEQRHYQAPPPPPAQPGYAPPAPPAQPAHGGHHGGYKDSPRPYGFGGGHYPDSPAPYGSKKRKKSFLEQLFD